MGAFLLTYTPVLPLWFQLLDVSSTLPWNPVPRRPSSHLSSRIRGVCLGIVWRQFYNLVCLLDISDFKSNFFFNPCWFHFILYLLAFVLFPVAVRWICQLFDIVYDIRMVLFSRRLPQIWTFCFEDSQIFDWRWACPSYGETQTGGTLLCKAAIWLSVTWGFLSYDYQVSVPVLTSDVFMRVRIMIGLRLCCYG